MFVCLSQYLMNYFKNYGAKKINSSIKMRSQHISYDEILVAIRVFETPDIDFVFAKFRSFLVKLNFFIMKIFPPSYNI